MQATARLKFLLRAKMGGKWRERFPGLKLTGYPEKVIINQYNGGVL